MIIFINILGKKIIASILYLILLYPCYSFALQVSFPGRDLDIETYDTAYIKTAHQYILLENIYSPLIEKDTRGNIISGVAEKFYWSGTDLIFEIRKDLKTAGGQIIGAKDVYTSFLRLFILNPNSHQFIKDILCGKKELRSIYEKCSHFFVEKNKIIIKAQTKKPFLLLLLNAASFSIIPQKSLDKNLKIINYHETSGPYYFEKKLENERLIFKANINHYRYDKEMPQRLEFIPSQNKTTGDIINELKNKKLDLILTINNMHPDHLMQLSQKDMNYNLHQTMKIRNFSLVFTDRGLQSLSLEERFYLGGRVRKHFRKFFSGKLGFEITGQFIQGFGHGSLSVDGLKEIQAKYQNKQDINLNKKIYINLFRLGTKINYSKILKNSYANIHIGRGFPSVDKKDEESYPHAIISGVDTGQFFSEDIDFISYIVNAGYFGMTQNGRSKWLRDYIKIDSKNKRLKKLQELHFKALSAPVIVPMVASSYVALTRKEWSLNLSNFYANHQIWRMRRN